MIPLPNVMVNIIVVINLMRMDLTTNWNEFIKKLDCHTLDLHTGGFDILLIIQPIMLNETFSTSNKSMLSKIWVTFGLLF